VDNYHVLPSDDSRNIGDHSAFLQNTDASRNCANHTLRESSVKHTET